MDEQKIARSNRDARTRRRARIDLASLTLLATLAALTGCANTAQTPKGSLTGPLELKYISSFGSNIPVIGEHALHFSQEVDRRTQGEMRFVFYEPGAIVPANDVLDAVASGEAEAGFTTSAYSLAKDTAFTLFGSFPFSPPMDQHWEWMRTGGGRKAMEDLYRPYGVMSVACGYMGAEGFGWFRKPVNAPEDLLGLKIRFFGLGARVMQKLGVNTQLLGGGDIYPALEKGHIDATEFSTPYMDAKYGFAQIVENYYFPGWHSPMWMYVTIVNLDVWEGLPPERQATIIAACEGNIRRSLDTEPARIAEGLATLESQGAVVRKTPPSIVAAAREAWGDVAREESRSSANFRAIFSTLPR